MRPANTIKWGRCLAKDAPSSLLSWYEELFNCPGRVDKERFADYFKPLCDDLQLVAEYPYTDKVYRNSYYHYHSAKYRELSRDCMRVFIFGPGAPFDSFPELPGEEEMQRHFLGYFILRPLPEHPFGRSMIAPLALKSHDFVSCLANESCSFMGMGLSVAAFPHESQDSETHSCAETAIWTVLEYYGNRFPEYRPALPSEIINALQPGSPRRLLPSKGLTVNEIARALQVLGIETQTYSGDILQETDFFRYLGYFLESGIPVILGIDLIDDNKKPLGRHAIVAIGHTNKELPMNPTPMETRGDIKLIDCTSLSCELVAMDDNFPPYSSLRHKLPGEKYASNCRNQSRIMNFIVPLHRHIYMDVVAASDLIIKILWNKDLGIPLFTRKTGLLFRLFLAEGRAFKASVLRNKEIGNIVKQYIIGTSLPRFVWICELSTPQHYRRGKAIGFMVIDATGSVSEDSLLIYLFAGRLLMFPPDKPACFQSCGMFAFEQYHGNLKCATKDVG